MEQQRFLVRLIVADSIHIPFNYSRRFDRILVMAIQYLKIRTWWVFPLLLSLGVIIGLMIQRPLRPTQSPETSALNDYVESIDWLELGRKMLAAPPKNWRTMSSDRSTQKEEFLAWFIREQDSFPITDAAVSHAVLRWFDGTEDDLYVTVTSPRGAKYQVTAGRYPDGPSRADVNVQFIGAEAWQAADITK